MFSYADETWHGASQALWTGNTGGMGSSSAAITTAGTYMPICVCRCINLAQYYLHLQHLTDALIQSQ